MDRDSLKIILKQVGYSIDLHKIIKFWIRKIENEGILIDIRGDQTASSYFQGVIKISCTENSSKGVYVLWDLLHEFGHHLDKDTSMMGFTPRELRAWEIARELIIDEEVYAINVDEFNRHMNSKLQTYRVNELPNSYKDKCTILFINGDEIEGMFQSFNNIERTFCLKLINGEYLTLPLDQIKQVN